MGKGLHMDNLDLPNITGHGLSLVAIFLAWIGVLTPVMAFLATSAAFLFYMVSILSSSFTQKWLKNRRRNKLHRLQKQLKDLQDIHTED